jgi:hypothetical protein
MKMVHPAKKVTVEWVDGIRIWRGLNHDGVWEESRSADTERGRRQEIAALYDMGWHKEN